MHLQVFQNGNDGNIAQALLAETWMDICFVCSNTPL